MLKTNHNLEFKIHINKILCNFTYILNQFEMLEKEFKYYLDNQKELLKKYFNKFIVIKDNKVVASFDSKVECYD